MKSKSKNGQGGQRLRRRGGTSTSFGLALLLVAASSFAVTAYFTTESPTNTVANAAVGFDGGFDPSTEEAQVASGSRGGEAWMLRAYRAQGRPGGPFDGESALCLRWKFGPELPLTNSCHAGGQALGDEAFSATSHVGFASTAFFGTVATSVDSLNLRTQRETYAARIYPSPRGLRLPFDFFVGFAPAGADVTVVAVEGDTTVKEQAWPAMPRLTAAVEGDGEGTVTGAHDCETTACPTIEDREAIIACGDDCWADLHDGEVVELRAEPAAGSRFAGWSGACSGLGDCIVRVSSDAEVRARFEELP